MNRSSIEKQKTGYVRALNIAAFAIMMISCLLNSSNARAAATVPIDYRLAVAGDKFADTRQIAVAFRMRAPRRLRGFRAKHFELAVGTISTCQERNPFVSLGPVWGLPVNNRSLFIELGISPSLLGGSSFNGRDLGGNFHFTSSAAISKTFGVRDAFPYRYGFSTRRMAALRAPILVWIWLDSISLWTLPSNESSQPRIHHDEKI